MLQIKVAAKKVGKFMMDAMSFEIPKEVSSHFDQVIGKLDAALEALTDYVKENTSLKADAETLQAKFDVMDEENKKLKTDLEEANKVDPAKLDALIAERSKIMDAAKKLKIDVKDKSIEDIKLAITQAVSPDFKADGKGDVYLAARFDMAMEIVAAKPDNTQLGAFRQTLVDNSTKNVEGVDHQKNFADGVGALRKEGTA